MRTQLNWRSFVYIDTINI